MKNSYKSSIGRIRSLRDLNAEKLRLEGELRRSEEGIHFHYHSIREALSFRNIIRTILDEIDLAGTAVEKTYTIGKKLFGGLKRKKKKKKHGPGNENGESKETDSSGTMPGKEQQH